MTKYSFYKVSTMFSNRNGTTERDWKLEKRFARPEIKMPHMRTSVLQAFNIKSIP